MTDFVCVGDAAQDNFFFIDEASVHCGLNKQNCTLEVAYGQKIPVARFGVACGGNAGNVAAGLARLGIITELVATFGNDERGAWLRRELLKNNVGLDGSRTREGGESNISSVIVFQNERTILSYHGPNEQIGDIPRAPWVYLSVVYDGVLEKLGTVKLAFNPSAADLRKGAVFLRSVVERTEVLIVNKEEMEILGMKGPNITVVTDGPNGADLFEGDKTDHFDAIPSVVLETTGAGDAFSSGFLAGLFYGQSADQAMVWGMKNASAVVTKLGAQEGLLTLEKIKI